MPEYTDPEINQAIMDAPTNLEHNGEKYIKAWKAGTNKLGNICVMYDCWTREDVEQRAWLDTVTGEVTED